MFTRFGHIVKSHDIMFERYFMFTTVYLLSHSFSHSSASFSQWFVNIHINLSFYRHWTMHRIDKNAEESLYNVKQGEKNLRGAYQMISSNRSLILKVIRIIFFSFNLFARDVCSGFCSGLCSGLCSGFCYLRFTNWFFLLSRWQITECDFESYFSLFVKLTILGISYAGVLCVCVYSLTWLSLSDQRSGTWDTPKTPPTLLLALDMISKACGVRLLCGQVYVFTCFLWSQADICRCKPRTAVYAQTYSKYKCEFTPIRVCWIAPNVSSSSQSAKCGPGACLCVFRNGEGGREGRQKLVRYATIF